MVVKILRKFHRKVERERHTHKERKMALHFLVGHPLHGESGPFERVREDEVVEEGAVLLPDLVLFVDYLLLLLDLLADFL